MTGFVLYTTEFVTIKSRRSALIALALFKLGQGLPGALEEKKVSPNFLLAFFFEERYF